MYKIKTFKFIEDSKLFDFPEYRSGQVVGFTSSTVEFPAGPSVVPCMVVLFDGDTEFYVVPIAQGYYEITL